MVNILLSSESRYPVNRKAVRFAVIDELSKNKVKSDSEISISIVGDRKMTELNNKFMGHEGTTDVLSFPQENTSNNKPGFISPPDSLLRLGDIVVSYPQAVRQAGEHNLLVNDEICNLIRHGVKHLLGIHHNDNVE